MVSMLGGAKGMAETFSVYGRGELVFYTRWCFGDPVEGPKELILQLCQLSGVERVETVWSLFGKMRWLSEEGRQDIIYFLESPATGWIRRRREVDIEVIPLSGGEEAGFEELGSNMPIEKIPEFWDKGKCLWINLGIHSPMSKRMFEAVEKGIPTDVRGFFVPGFDGMNFTIGYHDLYGDGPGGPRYLGIVFLSIAFPGIGVAKDWYAFEELVFELEEVENIRRELEEVTGPLEQTVLWDI